MRAVLCRLGTERQSLGNGVLSHPTVLPSLEWLSEIHGRASAPALPVSQAVDLAESVEMAFNVFLGLLHGPRFS